jgi:hypothetical protein
MGVRSLECTFPESMAKPKIGGGMGLMRRRGGKHRSPSFLRGGTTMTHEPENFGGVPLTYIGVSRTLECWGHRRTSRRHIIRAQPQVLTNHVET